MSNNHKSSARSAVIAALVVILAIGGAAGTAQAQNAAFQTLPTGSSISMSIPLFKSRVVIADQATGRVAVGNPDIADIVVISPTQLYVLAKDIGTTNVLFWSRENSLIGSINLEVVHDLDGLKAKFHQLMPTEPIEVYSAQRSIILRGRASNVSAMNAAVRIAEGYLAQIQTAKETQEFEQASGSRREDKAVGQVINLIEVGGSQQVMLEVKVAEIARTEVKRLQAQFNAIGKGANGAIGGVNGGATFPDVLFAPDNVRLPTLPGNFPWGPAIDEFAPNDMTIANQGLFGTFIDEDFLFNLAIDAAKEKGLAKILAEPTLTTLTGQEAQFLSGGRFPIPVSDGVDGVTVEFEEFGVAVKFLPVVLSDKRINLKVNVSVSELVDTGSLVLTAPGRLDQHLRAGAARAECKRHRRARRWPVHGPRRPHRRQPARGRDQVSGARRHTRPGRALPQQPVPQGPDRARDHGHAAPGETGCARKRHVADRQVRRADRRGILLAGPDRGQVLVRRPSDQVSGDIDMNLKVIVTVIGLVGIAACTNSKTATEADFGNSKASLIEAQSANPAAVSSSNAEAVTGVDPDYAGAVIEAMRENVSKPESVQQPISIRVGGQGQGGN